jgi:hypothetical protein
MPIIPNAESAYCDEAKITGYLLNLAHVRGASKAAFFAAHGFSVEDSQALAAALLAHVRTHDAMPVEDNGFGMRYKVDGPLETPSGRSPWVRSVWIIHHDGRPRLVSAYPMEPPP